MCVLTMFPIVTIVVHLLRIDFFIAPQNKN